MILTQCAACAAPLGLALGKKCGRCATRYCGPACQKQHWEQGGHDRLCKPMKQAGGAEQYNANNKYSEAVTVAAEACADDTKGQTCFICTQALHWKTKEGLVRGCACRGTAGFAHVSCLAEQVKILMDEAEANNLDWKPRWERWKTCSLCEQEYHGVVRCALGWACWKTYLSRPESDWCRLDAITLLGNGLSYAGRSEDALSVREAELSTLRRLGGSEEAILVVQGNLANTYHKLGRRTEALNMYRDVYSGWLKLNGEEHRSGLIAVNNYAVSLFQIDRNEEARSLLRRTIPVARRVLGENNEITLKMRNIYAGGLYSDPDATLEDLRAAASTFEELAPTARRVFGGGHPFTEGIERDLRNARAALGAHKIRATLPVPRFKVGARVECSVEEKFLEGTVVRHHYRESDWEPGVFAPYQVKLDGQSPGLIYARWDEDDCIRAAGADSDAETIK
jgi:tetratricopeptide (TPR) repeat protein